MRAIEPTEILVDNQGTVRSKPLLPNPWARFLARFVDYGLFFAALIVFQRETHISLFADSFIPFEYCFWIPLESLCLWAFRKTPGKWLLSIDVKQIGFRRPELWSSCKRSFLVWFRGIGMGITVLNILCLLIAYYRLRAFAMTSWDKEESFQITHRKVGRFRCALAILIALAGHFFYFRDKHA
jgi:hypothetical protein